MTDSGTGRPAEDSREADSAADDATPTAVAPTTSTAEQPSSAPVPAPTTPQPVVTAADQQLPAPPRRESNRIVGTAWVLLAAGLFQIVYFGAIAGLVLLLGGAPAVAPELAQYLGTSFAWLPVLLFFLLFELTVLIFNRAGRFLYVVASLLVGVLVWLLSVVLITTMTQGSVGDAATLERTALNPIFALIGLVAREVMLWTGVAIGARGTRVRRRNRERRDAYRSEVEHAGR